MKYITNINVDDHSKLESEDVFCRYDPFQREKILKYLRSFQPNAFTSAPVVDVFTKKQVAEADNGFTDGQYIWYESEIYYFERYGLPLSQDFVDYVMNI